MVRKEEFVDDVVLLALTQEAAETATRIYTDVARSFGLTVSLQKTKFMVVGVELQRKRRCQLSWMRNRSSVSVSALTWAP